MATPRAWVLNFDAEDELASNGPYAPTRAVLTQLERASARLQGLVPVGDIVLGTSTGRVHVENGTRGMCWCPTPRALRALRDAGASEPDAPAVEVIRRVNDREFSATLGQTLPGGFFARSLEQVHAAVGRTAPGENLVFKRALSYAGRGTRRVRAGEWSEADAQWVRASLAHASGLQVEPWVVRVMDVSTHGWLTPEGRLFTGVPTVATVDARGQWVGSRRAVDEEISSVELQGIHHEIARVARALHAVGYHGPFGIDAFRWRDANGLEQFNPRCEINARYSMGWAVGMGETRPDLSS